MAPQSKLDPTQTLSLVDAALSNRVYVEVDGTFSIVDGIQGLRASITSPFTRPPLPTDLRIKNIYNTGGTIRIIDENDTTFDLSAGAGEANTASNVGVGGVSVFKQKTGVDLEFNSIIADSALLTVTLDVGNNEIGLDLGSVASTDLSDATNIALLDATNAWSDGIKQTFNPSGTNAGINVGGPYCGTFCSS